ARAEEVQPVPQAAHDPPRDQVAAPRCVAPHLGAASPGRGPRSPEQAPAALHLQSTRRPVMARYRGPRLKKCRYVGTVLPGLTTVPTLDRPFPPGEHGTRRRTKPSDFKVRLIEKQKARFHFGIQEAQFQNYVK